MDGQINFMGKEVVEIKTKWGDLDMRSLPDGITREQLAELGEHDQILAVVRYSIEHMGADSKHDAMGMGVKPTIGEIRFRTLSKGFIIQGIEKAADIDADWPSEVGRTA